MTEKATSEKATVDEIATVDTEKATSEKATVDEIAWPLEFKLAKPATVFKEDYTKIVLREPTAADCLKFGVFDDALDGNHLLDLIACLSGLTPAIVRALPGTDMLRLSHRLIRVFLQAAK